MRHLLLITSVLWLIFLSCTEAPLQPEPIVEVGYKVYFQNYDRPEKWLTYNPETDILDSITLPTELGYRAEISPDGKRMYMSHVYGYYNTVIDLETKELITILPFGGTYLDLSPDGSLLAFSQNGLQLINTTDWSVKFSNSLWPMRYATFSNDGTQLLGSRLEGSQLLYGTANINNPDSVELVSLDWGGSFSFGGHALTSQPDDHWYLWSKATDKEYFVAWDPVADSAIYVDTIDRQWNALRKHHLSNDGRYVIYRSSSDYGTPPPVDASCEFRVYDTELGYTVDTVVTRIYHESGDTTHMVPYELVITPDSKWVVGTDFNFSNYIVIYNLETLSIERFVEIPGTHIFHTLVCQTGE